MVAVMAIVITDCIIIVLFATSGGSGFGKTLERLEDSAPGAAEIMEGVMLNGEKSKEELKEVTEHYI